MKTVEFTAMKDGTSAARGGCGGMNVSTMHTEFFLSPFEGEREG